MKPEDVQKLRKSLGVTQECFARMLGTSVITVNRWENARAKPSRLYIKEMKELAKNGSYNSRREAD